MRIILVRHAPSMGQKNHANYPLFGDSRVPLDPKDAHLSIKCGEFLREYLSTTAARPSSRLQYPAYAWNQNIRPLFNKSATPEWPLVWTSQFMRPQQTWTGIKQGVGTLFRKEATWHIDPRLNEQSFGILPYVGNLDDLENDKVASILASLSKELHKTDAFNSRTAMGESPRETLESIQNFLDGSFWRDVQEGQDDFLIVSHGAVMKAFIMNWFKLYDLNTWQDLKTPGNCDVYVIEGHKANWTVQKIYDGENMESLLDNPINPIAHIKKPTDFPSPPLPSQEAA